MVYTKTNGRICMSVFQRRSIFKPILTQKSILPFPKKGNRRSEHCFGQAYDDCETIKSVCDAGVNSNWIECVEIKWVEGQCLVSQQNVIVFTFSDHDGNHMRPVTGLLNLYIIMYVVFRLFSLTPHDNNDKFFIVKLSRFRQTVKTLNVNGLAMGVLYKIMCLLWQKLFSGRSIYIVICKVYWSFGLRMPYSYRIISFFVRLTSEWNNLFGAFKQMKYVHIRM